jgi:hypothetical protein
MVVSAELERKIVIYSIGKDQDIIRDSGKWCEKCQEMLPTIQLF